MHKNSANQITPNIQMKYHGGPGQSKHNTHQIIESKAKRVQQRPFSGGIQKMIKSENSKSRVQNLNQKNYSMYEHKQGLGSIIQNQSQQSIANHKG